MHNLLEQAKSSGSSIAIAQLIYHPKTQTLSKQGQPIDLEPRTLELLELLLTSVGQPMASSDIIDAIWQSKYISKNVLTNRISTLRAIFQEQMPDEDAAKLLVTYPRKGYFLNPASVGLNQSLPQKTPAAEPVAESQTEPSRRQLKLAYGCCLALLCCVVALLAVVWQQQGVSSQEARTQSLIPKVELLLNRIDVLGPTATAYRTAVKAILLQQQVEYPYTDIANQDAPSYFLDPLTQTPFFPGARNMRTSDYLVNLELKDGSEAGILKAQLSVINPSSDKLAFRHQYRIRVAELQSDLFRIHADMVAYFNLPKPSKSHWQLSEKHTNLLLRGEVSLDQISTMDEFTANTLARHLALFERDDAVIETFIDKTQLAFDILPDELSLWMGLLHYKVGKLDKAKALLTTPLGDSLIQNALIYTFVSHIAFKQNKLDQFRLNYMESLVALLRVMPSEALFERLSQPESKQTCLKPWTELKISVKDEVLVRRWRSLIEEHCSNVGAITNPI